MEEFKAKIREAGNSLAVTIPKAVVERNNLKLDQKITLELKQLITVICSCGKWYAENELTDHKCFYIKFSTQTDAMAALALLDKRKESE